MNGATSLDDFASLRAIRDFIVKRKSGSSSISSRFASPSTVEPKFADSEPIVPSTPVAQPTPGISTSELDAYLVNFVVEQTGYPEDMIELDADLEGDLGIDSIKKAQLLGELNEKFHFSTADDMNGATSLDDFASLRAIRDFMLKRLNVSETLAQPIVAPSQRNTGSTDEKRKELLNHLKKFVVEQTGYPEDTVQLDYDLETELGIDSVKKAQLFGELAENYAVFPLANHSLEEYATLRQIYEEVVKELV